MARSSGDGVTRYLIDRRPVALLCGVLVLAALSLFGVIHSVDPLWACTSVAR